MQGRKLLSSKYNTKTIYLGHSIEEIVDKEGGQSQDKYLNKMMCNISIEIIHRS